MIVANMVTFGNISLMAGTFAIYNLWIVYYFEQIKVKEVVLLFRLTYITFDPLVNEFK